MVGEYLVFNGSTWGKEAMFEATIPLEELLKIGRTLGPNATAAALKSIIDAQDRALRIQKEKIERLRNQAQYKQSQLRSAA